MPDVKKAIEQLLTSASKEARIILSRVFALEKQKLYLGSPPQGMADEVVAIVKEAVQ